MPTIITIGHQAFVLARASDAAPIIRALADARAVQHNYKAGKSVYWPDEEAPEITVVSVPAERLLKGRPEPEDERRAQCLREVGR